MGAVGQQIEVGQLVKMKRGYSAPGLVLEVNERAGTGWWVRVLWSDEGPGMERMRDLVAQRELEDIDESR